VSARLLALLRSRRRNLHCSRPSRVLFVQKQRLAPGAPGDEGRELPYKRRESEINVYSSMCVFVHTTFGSEMRGTCSAGIKVG